MNTAVYLNGRPVFAAATQRVTTFEPIDGTDGVLSTVRNVELCMAGIEYPLASGPKTFTPDDLVEAVASQQDPAVQAPRVWLGHPDDQRFHAGRTTPAGSAEPALGKVINMRVEDNGLTLVGDIAGCPTWLAKILSSAFPSRSVEGLVEAQTVTGHTWGLLITDLALLGVTWPGVSTLEDLQALYSENGPAGIAVEEESMAVAAARGVVQAQINDDDIRRQFYAALPDMDLDSWSWIRAQLRDPDELIVDPDDGSGDLYKVGYSITGEDVEFGEPEKVKIAYVNASQKRDANARTLLTSMLTKDHVVVASWDERAKSRPDTTKQEGDSVNPEVIQALRARLGLTADQLPDNATEAQVLQAMRDDVADPSLPENQVDPATVSNPSAPAVQETTTPGGHPGSTAPGNDPQAPAPSPDQQAQGPNLLNEKPAVNASAALPAGMVAVPADQWATVQRTMQSVAAQQATSQQEADVRLVEDSIRAGKLYPYQREGLIAQVKNPKTRDAVVHLLTASVEEGGLLANTVPVTARGMDSFEAQGQTDAYPAEWLPEIQAQQGSTPNVVMEG